MDSRRETTMTAKGRKKSSIADAYAADDPASLAGNRCTVCGQAMREGRCFWCGRRVCLDCDCPCGGTAARFEGIAGG